MGYLTRNCGSCYSKAHYCLVIPRMFPNTLNKTTIAYEKFSRTWDIKNGIWIFGLQNYSNLCVVEESIQFIRISESSFEWGWDLRTWQSFNCFLDNLFPSNWIYFYGQMYCRVGKNTSTYLAIYVRQELIPSSYSS